MPIKLLGVTGDKHPRVLDAVIRANHADGANPIVFPDSVSTNERLWREPTVPEFYVDFETVSHLDDDFASFPEPGGQPLIFMIGCGQLTGAVGPPRLHRAGSHVGRRTQGVVKLFAPSSGRR